jgi:ubiquinone/menaquinone biosynthesis C-methylase UbiE/uncharacterized protein YbaR (Trm112 family)
VVGAGAATDPSRADRGPVAVMTTADLVFCCPACRGTVERETGGFRCVACGHRYPIVAGIADFRLEPDPWISLEDDRDKALRLEVTSAGEDFLTTVKRYWDMTPATPAQFAQRFRDHVAAAEARSREWLESFVSTVGVTASPWIDVGCGTADLAAAAPSGQRVVGVDIALRWLVAARKRLQESGRADDLVCCNAEHLPFPDASFAHAVSLGAVEHIAAAGAMLSEARRTLRPGGRLRLRTLNRFTLLPEPHVDVWGVGWMPRRYADAFVRRRSGQRYLHHQPLSRAELSRGLRAANFRDIHVEPARLLEAERSRLGALAPVAGIYESVRGLPLIGYGLSWVAPMLEARAVAS